jgi:CheY-like chemotaxis protein
LPGGHGSDITAGPVAPGIRTFNPNGEIPVPHDSAGAEPPRQEPKQDSKQDLQPRAAMPRILVVDDDPMVCMAIEIHLERHNFQVTIADGGEAGLRALEGMNFDLMIVDIFMPHMRGFESIRIFHERAPSVPLIAMSGYAFANLDTPAPDFLRMALELGATRCLRKPFTPVALLTVIHECLADVPSPSATAAQPR